jgi:preprotein translocase subunit SecA
MIMLSVLDGLWKDHLLSMDHLKEGIGLRGYAQQDPLVAYKRESFDMFEAMMNRFQEDTVRFLFLMQIIGPDGQPVPVSIRPRPSVQGTATHPQLQEEGGAVAVAERPAEPVRPPVPIQTRQPSTTIDQIEAEFQRKKKRELDQARMAGSNGSTQETAQRRTGDKVGRNDPCPCGSGKKYKKCHGAEGLN